MRSDATDHTPATVLPVGHYVIVPSRTTVRMRTRHLFGLGSVSGTFDLLEGHFTIADPIRDTSVHAIVDAASFDTGNSRRDTDVRSAKYLDVTAHPTITFDCRVVHEHEGRLVASGLVTAHGVAVPTTLTLEELDAGDGELSLRVAAQIDRFAHGVTAGRGMAARWLSLEILVIATRRDR